MKQLVQFYSSVGLVKIINLPEFVRHVCKRSQMEQMKNEITTFSTPRDSLICSHGLPQEAVYERITHKLDKIGQFSIPHQELATESNMRSGLRLKALVERELDKKLYQYVTRS